MKLDLRESYPGEFLQLTHGQKRRKLHKAMALVAQHIGLDGGEVDVVDDLAALLDPLYEERKARMLAEISQAVIDAAE